MALIPREGARPSGSRVGVGAQEARAEQAGGSRSPQPKRGAASGGGGGELVTGPSASPWKPASLGTSGCGWWTVFRLPSRVGSSGAGGQDSALEPLGWG